MESFVIGKYARKIEACKLIGVDNIGLIDKTHAYNLPKSVINELNRDGNAHDKHGLFFKIVAYPSQRALGHGDYDVMGVAVYPGVLDYNGKELTQPCLIKFKEA